MSQPSQQGEAAVTSGTSALSSQQARLNRVFVHLPSLSAVEKGKHAEIRRDISKMDPPIDEIIGEYQEGKYLYYFARYKGGIAYKYIATYLLEKYKTIVQEYKRKKAQGSLAPFDPSASYVHPKQRVRVKIRIGSTKSSSAPPSDGQEVVPDSEEDDDEDDEDEDDDEDDDDEYEGFGHRVQPARASRAHTTKDLPFSPRKSRSRKIMTVQSDTSGAEEDSDIVEISRPTRRLTRSRKVTEINLVDSDEDYVESFSKPKSHGARARVSRPKAAVPMYGHFRDIKTVDEDPFSDDEDNAPLRCHRKICEKCYLPPAHRQLAAFKRKKKGRKRKRGTDDEFEESESEEMYQNMGGWVQCLKCPVAAHWKCLAKSQQEEILKAVREKNARDWAADEDRMSTSNPPSKRSILRIDETTEFICGACNRGGICLGCMETALDLASKSTGIAEEKQSGDAFDTVTGNQSNPDEAGSRAIHSLARGLLFRCLTCKRLAHYEHLPKPPGFNGDSPALIAEHYQTVKSWLCGDCASYKYSLDKIIAWRPYPATAVEEKQATEVTNYKSPLPREYLVKWAARSYRRVEWVPHMWLLSTNPTKLKNFIIGGPKVELLKEPTQDDGEDGMDVDQDSGVSSNDRLPDSESAAERLYTGDLPPTAPVPDAQRRIPLPWKTVGRVLDILLWRPTSRKPMPKGKQRHKRIIADTSEEEDEPEAKRHAFEKGEEPPADFTATLDEWEDSRDLDKADIKHVVWVFIKWDELPYEEATWDAPPRPKENGYEAYRSAFEKFVDSRKVLLPNRDKKYWDTFDKRVIDGYGKYRLKKASDLALGQAPNLQLMDFQVDGFNWLSNNWWNLQHCILADEMGLGKTVQIATFLGNIALNWKACPALVVVPNSTITNWVRELERWAPQLRVVPFYGEKNSRDIIKQFELFHKKPEKAYLNTKFHVLVTTYETLTNAKDFTTVFKNQPRWEVLVVDEGQRLKSDTSLIFKKLNELNTIHRIIMTGTPLNNNVRELFNLMNFLDPTEWKDLGALEKQHETLDEELVKQLHTRLRPYFLRRVKAEVLKLPPKNEVIVPLSMSQVQKEVYRSILTHNLELLKGLSQPAAVQGAPTKSRINNVLMQLRKCIQHPYLYASEMEPRNLAAAEVHEKLIDASGKLRFLRCLLPKLKARGHRVLLFSQFKIALDIIEDFLVVEGYKILRLDGDTKNSVRQKSMDEFNKQGSDYFIFLLTTRAGGVGINLYSADTVIIFDPDFNPHQDLQAIARAYRYGQQKTCLVFKLMIKDSAEERIMQVGKKKLVLDHLIVQKMDDDDDTGGEDVQSILTYGAQALFDDTQESRDIVYSDHDIDSLIERTEKEAVLETPKTAGGFTFAFAKIWAADKDTLEEVIENDQMDSWGQTLQKLNEERENEQQMQLAQSGRGSRRRAADIAKSKILGGEGSQTFDKANKANSNIVSDGSAYNGSERGSEVDSESDEGLAGTDDDFHISGSKTKKTAQANQDNGQSASLDCGLCGMRHATGDCVMVERSENLVEYREMLILHADDEPWEQRSEAVQMIDEILRERGQLALIAGQPLHPLPKPVVQPAPKRTKPSMVKNATLPTGPKPTKRPSPMPPAPCVLCQEGPHRYQDCPVVTSGSKSILKHLRILESRGDPSLTPVVDKLRKLLAKAKSREATEMADWPDDGQPVAGPSRLVS